MFKLLSVNKSFRSLWIGQLISALGDRLTQMGILTYLMVSGQDKGDKAALITFLGLLPFLLLGPLCGALVDRYSRKLLMVWADIFRGCLVVLIPVIWMQTHSIPVMAIWFFTLGSFTALFSPAKMSIIANLTEKDTLLEANSLIVTTGTVATLIGTFIAGAVIKFIGIKAAFYINGLTYIISAIFIYKIVYKKTDSETIHFKNSYSMFLIDIKEGANYIRNHRIIKRLIMLCSCFSLISSFAYILILNYGAVLLKLNSFGIGCLLSAAGLGMVAGSVILTKKKDAVNYAKVLGVSFSLIGIACTSLFFGPKIYLALVILFFAGLGAAIVTITLETIFQRLTPDDLKGKVFAVKGLGTNAVFLVSLLLAGGLVKVFSATLLFGFVGMSAVIIALQIILYEKHWGYQLLRLFLKLFLKFYFGFKVTGRENLLKKRKVIFAGNHTSFIDGIVLMCAYPGRIYFLAADSLFKTIVWGWLAKRLGYIPIKREGFNKESIKEAVEILKTGDSIGIFPEGHITLDGRLSEGKEGVALIARLSGVDIVPFAIEGAYEAWPLSKKYPRRFPVSIRFDKPIDVSQYQIREELTQEVMSRISKAKLYLEREGYLKVDPDEIIKHLINIG